ncbi:hypothetical protein [Chryseobacterium timonianum]|uniref:hypothetical protein n=1 Tax=Chryseobacterium timonianum TaxID=1805473 RepID=UPI001F4AE657|nr:hypothetical protein [Chryseobacterium timonianum]
MKNILISFLFAAIIGFLVFFFKRNELNNSNSNNIILLVILMVISVPLIKWIFPMTKELGIGTSKFYPNLIRKVQEFIKK